MDNGAKISLEPLKKMAALLEMALTNLKTDLERAGAVQFFEVAYELSWKTLRKAIIQEGVEVKGGPKVIYREAGRLGLIEDPEIWFEFIDRRNETSHTYNEETADRVVDSLDEFLLEFKKLINTLENLK